MFRSTSLQHGGDEADRKAHQRDRQREAKDQNDGMLAGGASDREHIVERHRDIGDNDLPGRLGEGR
jgi:hypothetical protein